MSHIEKERLIKADLASIENRVRHAFNQGYELGRKDALGQAPTPKESLVVEDTISRKAVIDSLYDWSNHSMTDAEIWHLRQVIGDIKSMPSVESKADKEDE